MKNITKKRLLITGVSGLLGSNIAYRLRGRYEILGFFHNKPVSIDGVDVRCVDLCYKLHTEAIVRQFNPDVIFHAAAQTNVDVCENNPLLARELNVQSTENLVDILLGMPTQFIYVSTDLVYDGIRGGFIEDDIPGPRNHYAITKLEGEKAALSRKNTLVLRTNFFGWSLFEKRSLGEWVIEELRSGRTIQGFKDAVFSSIYTFDLAEIVDHAIQKRIAGVYNCVSRTSLSKYNFLISVAKGAGLDLSLIKPVSIDDAGLIARRSKNLSLNVSKLSHVLGENLPSIEESINHFLEDLKYNYRQVILSRPQEAGYYPFLNNFPYGRQCIDNDDIASVVDVLKTGNLTQGPKIEEFERNLVEITGASFAAAVNSATSALHIACMSINVEKGDEVLVSTNTFVASANCVLYCGGRPIFVDIDALSYNFSPMDIEKKITSRTKAVIAVHFAGQSCDMESISTIVRSAEKRNGRKIYIIEDASHALGSFYNGKQVGSCAYSDIIVMSFHPVKHITTAEGGVLLTNDRGLHRKFCYLRSHGITSYPDELTQSAEAFEQMSLNSNMSLQRNPWYYEQQWLGYNYRITDLQCALGVSQLRKLPAFVKRRREIVLFYNKSFSGIKGISIPYESSQCQSNFHLYVLRIDFKILGKYRAEVMNALRQQGIGTQVHYIPVHTQPYYQMNLGTRWNDQPVAEEYYRQCLSIPLYPGMRNEDVDKVVAAVKENLGV